MSRTHTHRRWLALALVAAGGSAALLGCPGTLDDPQKYAVIATCDAGSTCGSTTSTNTPMLVTTARVQAELFVGKCNSCHGATSPLGELSLTGTALELEGRIVESVSVTAICRGSKLVVPGKPDRSLMYVKMTNTTTCGGVMPFGGQPNAVDAALVRQWIIDLEAQ